MSENQSTFVTKNSTRSHGHLDDLRAIITGAFYTEKLATGAVITGTLFCGIGFTMNLFIGSLGCGEIIVNTVSRKSAGNILDHSKTDNPISPFGQFLHHSPSPNPGKGRKKTHS